MPLKIVKREGSPIWYVRGTVAGREIYRSTKTDNRARAEQIRIRWEVELIEEADNGPTILFQDAILSYLQTGGETTYIEQLADALGAYPINEVNQALIDIKARETYPTQSNASIKRWFYDPAVAVLRHAAKRGMCALTLIEKPKVKRPAPKWAEMEWFEAFWPHCTPELLALTTLLPYTGVRISEALNLVWERVNLVEGWAYIPETKNGLPRTIHLPANVVACLKAIQPASCAGRVFPWGMKDAANKAIRVTTARVNATRKAEGREPIQFLSSHKIGSHTYATWMRRYAGMDHRGLVGTGRWKHPSSTFIYTHTVATDEARKADMLPGARLDSAESPKNKNGQ